ncbi:MAG: flagellar protein FliT [Methylobacter sp.]
MPSKTEERSVDQCLQFQLEELTTLSNQVSEYVAGEQWEQLVVALDLRQQCLETLFSEAVVQSETLKSLASSILEQDAVLVARIQKQKKIVEKQILAFDKGRQAIQAYGST